MMKLSSDERQGLLRLAETFPKGSDERKSLLKLLRASRGVSAAAELKKWGPMFSSPHRTWKMTASASPGMDAPQGSWGDPSPMEVDIEMKIPAMTTFDLSNDKAVEDLDTLTRLAIEFFSSIRKAMKFT